MSRFRGKKFDYWLLLDSYELTSSEKRKEYNSIFAPTMLQVSQGLRYTRIRIFNVIVVFEFKMQFGNVVFCFVEVRKSAKSSTSGAYLRWNFTEVVCNCFYSEMI